MVENGNQDVLISSAIAEQSKDGEYRISSEGKPSHVDAIETR
jgi:hypothetical protein